MTAVKEYFLSLRPQFAPLVMDGRKTMTRRLISPQPSVTHRGCPRWGTGAGRRMAKVPRLAAGGRNVTMHELIGDYCPYGSAGDTLVFLTRWATKKRYDKLKPTELPSNAKIWTAFDGAKPDWCGKSRPGRFMPLKFRDRLPRFRNEGVRVERLHEISEEDARAEGVVLLHRNGSELDRYCDHRYYFQCLWNDINGPGSWKSNPWVWVVYFREER